MREFINKTLGINQQFFGGIWLIDVSNEKGESINSKCGISQENRRSPQQTPSFDVWEHCVELGVLIPMWWEYSKEL